MIRLIKRYESRKLYDTEESRYVSLDEIATWVRQGQEVRVVDNGTTHDVTSQTLTQIILDEGRKGTSFLPSELLHDLVRIGERAVSTGMEQVQHGVDRLIDRLGPVRKAREEMSSLRSRLEELEVSLAELERTDHTAGAGATQGVVVEPQNGRPAERKPAARIETEGEIIK
jgi:polyhydroxyalkanoate synthesis repressor PhaR